MSESYTLGVDKLTEWFSIGKQISKIQLDAGATDGFGIINPDDDRKKPKTSFRTEGRSETEYVKEYLAREAAAVQKKLSSHDADSSAIKPLSHLSEVDEVTTVGVIQDMGELDEELTQVYDNYNFKHQYNPKLLVARHREEIVNTVDTQQVLVIEGATGCGKTTQVPQYILDHHVQLRRHCNIIVTQPRRIAAMSVAKRVCYERGWTVGDLVGFQVGLNKVVKPQTRLVYVTTGVLLQRLISAKHMNDYTHIILDEVHERDQEMDMCLLLVKKFINTVSRNVKVILMSATFDVNLFSDYFALPYLKTMQKPITISLQGKSYTVSEHWIDDLSSLGTVPDLDPTKPEISQYSYDLAYKLVKVFDSIETKEQCADINGLAPNRGSVLIFLPGIEEISQMERMFSEEQLTLKWWILPLHSTITVEEQSRVFEPPQIGDRKIILSTNIAESSVTVPDIKYVIDFCLTRNLFCDNDSNYTHLRLEWASKANCKQRKGRAGRVSSGRVYRMITSQFYDNYLPEFIVPEMKRCPLEQIILKIKLLGLEEPTGILALALEPPNLSDIERAVLALKEVGALDLLTEGNFYPFDGDLTFIGRVLAVLPLDIHLGKLICLGIMFDCLKMCIVIAAGLSLKTCFSKPLKEQLNAYRNKVAWANTSFSDCMAIWHAFRLWKIYRNTHRFRRPNSDPERIWCKNNFLQLKRLMEMSDLVDEIIGRLDRLNIKCDEVTADTEKIDTLMLQVVIAGAFYPHYFIRVPLDEKLITRTLSGRDPFTTVMLSGLPPNQGILYQTEIERFFSNFGTNIVCHFEDSKVYVEFSRTNESKPLRILPMVYLAVKMRQLRTPLDVQLYVGEALSQRLRTLELLTSEHSRISGRLRTNRMSMAVKSNTLCSVPLPSLQDTTMSIYITQVIECGHFWAHYGTGDAFDRLKELKDVVNRHSDTLKPIEGPITPGQICLAPDYNDGRAEFHRARVETVGDVLEVFFVDYGNTETRKREEIRAVSPILEPVIYSVPMQSFECRLSEFRPSARNGEQWYTAAKAEFITCVSGKSLNARVYSVVHNVVHLELILKFEDGRECSLNEYFKRSGFGEYVEESDLSKQNNQLRQKYWSSNYLFDGNNDNELKLNLDTSLDSGKPKGRIIRLRGPESPLEVQYVGIMQSSRTRQVRIENDSVNSVSLDPEPQDPSDRMMVASHVGLTAAGTSLIARSTTLMPNIRGLPAILALVFAPHAELRCDAAYRRYTGALCGLGFHPENDEPLYPEHDAEITFDSEFTTDDLLLINSIRMSIYWILHNSTDSFHLTANVMTDMQKRICSRMRQLLQVKREAIEPVSTRRPYSWNMIPESRQLKPDLENRDPDCEHVLHRGIVLDVEASSEADQAQYMLDHIMELHTSASRSMQRQEIACELCQQICHSPHELLLHLKSPRHMMLEKALDMQLQK